MAYYTYSAENDSWMMSCGIDMEGVSRLLDADRIIITFEDGTYIETSPVGKSTQDVSPQPSAEEFTLIHLLATHIT